MRKVVVDVIHGERARLVNKPIDGNPVVPPFDARYSAVVAHVVEGGGGNEPLSKEGTGGWLHIEGVPACNRVLQGTTLIRNGNLCCLKMGKLLGSGRVLRGLNPSTSVVDPSLGVLGGSQMN